ncbi:MAG: acyl-CoA reductase [Verrucomicrobiota bacterium]
MKTSERIELIDQSLSSVSSSIFVSAEDLTELLQIELGHREALDAFIPYSKHKRKAIAPRKIYYICASNLDISAQTSLIIGLLLGSELTFKIPTQGLSAFSKLVEELPISLKQYVTLISEHQIESMAISDVVVVFGTDQTIASVKEQTHWKQRFLGYGHKLSFGFIPKGNSTEEWAKLAVQEINAYNQLGCLSPQAYFCHSLEEAEQLTDNIRLTWKQEPPRPLPDDFALEAKIYNARQECLVDGIRIFTPQDKGLDWTIGLHPCGSTVFRPMPGYRFIQIYPTHDLASMLNPWKNNLSALSVASEEITPFTEEMSLPFSRFCQTGRLQTPPLQWLHDGRPRLADLVTWQFID